MSDDLVDPVAVTGFSGGIARIGGCTDPMPDIHDRLALIKDESPDAISAILVDCLAHARPDERQTIFRALLDTKTAVAWSTLIRNLEELDTHVRRSLVLAKGPIRAAFHHIVARNNDDGIRRAVQLVRERGDASVMSDLAGLLLSDLPWIPRITAQAMLSITRHHVGDHGQNRVSSEVAGHLDSACATALRSYRTHREEDVLLVAALLTQNPGPKMRSVLEDEDLGIGIILHGVCSRTDYPLVRRNLLAWLGSDRLERSAARALHTVETPRNLEEVYASAHLLLHPKRKTALRRVHHGVRCVPMNNVLAQLSVPVQGRFPSVVCGLGISRSRKVELLSRIADLPERFPRLMATHAMVMYGERFVSKQLMVMADDPEVRIASLAAGPLLRNAERLPRDAMALLCENRHPDVARRARRLDARHDVGSFFDRWMDLDRNDRLSAAHYLLAHQSAMMIDGLQHRLVHGSRDERLAVIYLCRRLGLVVDLEKDLIAAAHDEDARVASASIAALPEGDSPSRLAVIRTAMEHDDSRVQANAIEAVVGTAHRDARRLDRPMLNRAAMRLVRPHVESSDNRARANAIRALADGRERHGEELLRHMLSDERALHRISALWVAGRCRTLHAMDAVEKMAREDPVDSVRQRAEEASRRIRSRAS